MQVVKIGTNSVKVTVDIAEVLASTGLSVKEFNVVSPKMQAYIRSLIYDPNISNMLGRDGVFHAKVSMHSDRLEVLLTLSKDIAESLLPFLGNSDILRGYLDNEKPRKRTKIDRELERVIIVFPTLDLVMQACSRVVFARHRRLKNTHLLYSEGEYFISLDPNNYIGCEDAMEEMIAILREFGDEVEDTEPALIEHGKLLLDADAIRVMAKLN